MFMMKIADFVFQFQPESIQKNDFFYIFSEISFTSGMPEWAEHVR